MSNLRSSVVKATLWSIGTRWGNRVLGFVNVAVVARLLDPQDFGLVAMAMLTMGLIEVWFALGVESAVIQRQESSRELLDTAWTIRAIQGVTMGSIVVLAAPLAARFMNEARIESLLYVLTLGIFVSGFSNIGVVSWHRELDFRREFMVGVVTKILSILATWVLAIVLRNYWALAWGIVAGYAFGFAASYLAHPYRPWFSLTRWRELLSFSQWTLVSSILAYASTKIDEIMVGRFLGPRDMGLYTMAGEVANMATAELSAPVLRVLFPTYSMLQNEPGRLAVAFLNGIGTVAAVTMPAAVGLALVADEAIVLFLGSKWLAAAPLVGVFALLGCIRAISGAAGTLLNALGAPRLVAAGALASLLLFIGLGAGVLWMGAGLFGLAAAKAITTLVNGLINWAFVLRRTQVTVRGLGQKIWRPMLASTIMAATLITAIGAVAPLLPASAVPLLVVKVLFGATVYTVAALCLWIAAGRPDGFERMVLERVQAIRTRIHGMARKQA